MSEAEVETNVASGDQAGPENTLLASQTPGEDTEENSADEIQVKHPLQNCWALWYFKNDRSRDWNENLKLVAKFQFVEDFWALYNHIQPASKLNNGCDYSIFKDGIQPAWEDPRNKKGGRWLITLNKNNRNTELDHFWLETLLCLIGEAFEEHSDDICGATINLRGKADKLAIWTGDASNKDGILSIGKKLKERLGVPTRVTIGYEVHDDTISRKGSVAKSKYSL